MSKQFLSTLFLVLFITLIAAPTVIVMVDDTIDHTVLISKSVDEEEKGSEKKLNIEFVFEITIHKASYVVYNTSEDNLDYFYKTYTKPHLNILSPPPDLYII